MFASIFCGFVLLFFFSHWIWFSIALDRSFWDSRAAGNHALEWLAKSVMQAFYLMNTEDSFCLKSSIASSQGIQINHGHRYKINWSTLHKKLNPIIWLGSRWILESTLRSPIPGHRARSSMDASMIWERACRAITTRSRLTSANHMRAHTAKRKLWVKRSRWEAAVIPRT